MIVYTDLISGDQVLSDSYAQKPLVIAGEEVPDIFVVQSRLVTKSIGDINTGANKATETTDDDEGVEDKEEKVVDLKDPIMGFGYEGPASMSAADFVTLYKSWCKTVKEKIEAANKKPKAFMQSAKAFMPFIKDEFKNFEVYHPKSYNSETFVLGWWDDEVSYFHSLFIVVCMSNS